MSSDRIDGDVSTGNAHATVRPHDGAPEIASGKLLVRVVREGGKATDREIVASGELVRIGSHEQSDLVLADRLVSRSHCRLVKGRTVWRVSDTGSLNGTMIDGVRVRDGDLPPRDTTMTLGESELLLRPLPEGLHASPSPPPLRTSFGELCGTSAPMRRLFTMLESVAASDATVLIEGESGTGKELAASEIVRRGPRAQKPFVIVDCGSISRSLIESELFGHRKGAFTGADREHIGVFEAADGGTVFLDEIGEMPLDLQPKLLRAIESREIRRIGDSRSRKVDVRVLAATNRRLDREVNLGRFREDLFFRLSVVTVTIPPLRERVEDLEMLVAAILDGLGASEAGKGIFTGAVLEDMARHDWPGNVRELRNFVERAIVLGGAAAPAGATVVGEGVAAEPLVNIEVPFREAKDDAIAKFERAYAERLLEWSEGNISRAARKARMDRMNLHRLIRRYGLRDAPPLKD
jgi:transcriptional regulator with GAF, ATPase, and Fis domain